MISASSTLLRQSAQQASKRMTAATQVRNFAAAQGDVVGIDLGTTNSCVAVMEVGFKLYEP
jgi:actin-like ATPase involved in cell morphogenesis